MFRCGRAVCPLRGHRSGSGSHPCRKGGDGGSPALQAHGRAETILFNLSGHGHFDMAAYIEYFSGKLQDVSYDESELAKAMAQLPQVAA